MRILFDLCHPAHVHLFRNAISYFQNNDHDVRITIRNKDITRQLLELYQLPYVVLSDAKRGRLQMGLELAQRNLRLMSLVRKWRPDAMVGMAGVSVAQVGWLMRIPSLVLTDTESGYLQNRLSIPFANRVCTPACYLLNHGDKQVRYKGYHELAYLHPDYFQPDISVRDELGLQAGTNYSLVRFVNWGADHDRGRSRLSLEAKRRIVDTLAEHGPVFISTEGAIPDEFEKYRFPLAHTRMHDAIASASILVGESNTMASEAAVLGVPSIFFYPDVELGYTREQHVRWKILHWLAPEANANAQETIREILSTPRQHWREIGQRIVADSVDVTSFICDQVLSLGNAPNEEVAS